MRAGENAVHVYWIFRQFHPVLSGAGERFRRYVPGLQTRGVRPEVHTAMPPHEEGDLASYEVLTDGLAVHRHAVRSEDPARKDALLARAMRRSLVFSGASVNCPVAQVLSTHPALLKELIALRLSRQRFRPLLVGTMVEPVTLPPGTLMKRCRRGLKRWLLRRAFAGYVASSSVMAERFRNDGAPASRVHVIGNGVDTCRFRPVESPGEKTALRRELGLPEDDVIALYVGNLIPRKGLDRLVGAWSLLHESGEHARYKLILMGPNSRPDANDGETAASRAAFVDALKRQIAGDPLQSMQLWRPGNADQVAKIMRAADVFVFPSRKEGMGNVVLEAMSSGLPVIMTDFIGRPAEEFGRPGTHFVLSGEQPQELAACLGGMLEHKEERQRLGVAARRWAVEQLDVEKTLDSYARLYACLAFGEPEADG